jgi:hypothetical protein
MAAPQKANRVAQALEAKGMERDEKHHHMFRKEIAGVTELVTRMSHNAPEINDHLGGLMAKQCCLQLREFWELVDCPLSEEEWDQLVTDRCVGGRNPFLGF